MKVTVCQLNDAAELLKKDWDRLVTHVKREASELVVLPEMPFYPWVAGTAKVDPAVWEASMQAHGQWMARFQEIAPATIAGTRPVLKDGKRLNEGFVWDLEGGYRPVHHKYYLPDEKYLISGLPAGVWRRLSPARSACLQTGGIQRNRKPIGGDAAGLWNPRKEIYWGLHHRTRLS